jgi:hypothetical protein
MMSEIKNQGLNSSGRGGGKRERWYKGGYSVKKSKNYTCCKYSIKVGKIKDSSGDSEMKHDIVDTS